MAKQDSSGWLVNPAHDLVFYSGLSFTGALLVLALGRVFEPSHLFVWFNLVLTVGHYAPTWMRAFLDKGELKAHRVSIVLFPVLFVAMLFATRAQPEVLAFLIYFWDRFHALMQNYGFLRLYDAKAVPPTKAQPGARGNLPPTKAQPEARGNLPPTKAQPEARGNKGWAELTLLFSSAFLLMSFNMGLLAPFLNQLRLMEVPVPATEALVWTLRGAAGLVTAGALGVYVRAQLRLRAEGSFSVGKQVFLGLLMAGHAVMNTTTSVFLLSAHEKLYHSVQYVVLVWHYSRRRVVKAPAAEVTPPMRALFSGRSPLLYVLGIAAFVGLVAFGFERFGFATGAAGQGFAFTTVGSGIALAHYYFDSFLWRVRRETVRVNL